MRALVTVLAVVGLLHADEPTYQGKPASYWVTQVGLGDTQGRLLAIRAVASFPPDTPGVIDALMKGLADGVPEVRATAISGLGSAGPKAAPAVDALGKALADPDTGVRTRAAAALGRIGAPALAAKDALAAAIDDRERPVQLAACGALEALPLDPKERIALARRAMKGKATGVRAWGLRLIASLGRKATEAEPELIALLLDADGSIRQRAAEALGRIHASEQAIPPLVQALSDKDPDVVDAAGGALASMGGPAARPAFDLLAQKDGNTWEAASQVIGEMGKEAEPILPDLTKMLRDKDEVLRQHAAATLARLGQDGMIILHEALKDQDEGVRKTAWEALPISKAMEEFARRSDPAARGKLVASGGGTQASEDAVAAALGWLARHQSADGHWKCAGFGETCAGAACVGPGNEEFDVGVTGLAVLAFLGAGHGPVANGPGFGPVVRNGVDWLIAQQTPTGAFGKACSKEMYNDAIATCALVEAYGATDDELIGKAAQKGIDALVRAKNPYKAWRYTPMCGENDTSVTTWCVMALAAAERADLNVGHSTLVEVSEWIDEITDKNYGKCGYQSIEDAGVKVVIPGKNETYAQHEALAGAGMVVRLLVDHDWKDPILGKGAKLLEGDLPVWNTKKKTSDYYFWYYGTLALFLYDGPDSGRDHKTWKSWNAALQEALVKNQRAKADGCAEGSWDADDRWGWAGGRVYATALNALTLETYYRFPGAKPPKKK